MTGRTVEIIGGDDPPDVIALMDGVETGVELTAIMCASAEDIMLRMHRLAKQKHEKYDRRGLLGARPMILLSAVALDGGNAEAHARLAIGFGQYDALFRASEIDADILLELTDVDLEKLGVPFGSPQSHLRFGRRRDIGLALRIDRFDAAERDLEANRTEP